MALSEFAIIKKYFDQNASSRQDVLLGIGDDCALLKIPPQSELAVSMDTLVAGVHFFADADPYAIGYKSLAVNLSDLAAMGAEPAWVTLSLTIPEANEAWLQQFSAGFFQLLNEYSLQLVGGDTTRGPMSITVQVHGFIPENQAIQRKGAQPGDLIYVTGELGDAGVALQWLRKQRHLPEKLQDDFLQRLYYPIPRIAQGIALRQVANCAIDISDGLAADVGHLLESNNMGATVFVDDLPLSAAMQQAIPLDEAWQIALTSGDDYELCFTIAKEQKKKLESLPPHLGKMTQVGIIELEPGLRLQRRSGELIYLDKLGYRHF